MQTTLDFLINYKEVILAALSVVLTIVLIFIKRKPKTIDDFYLAVNEVLAIVPDLVSKVEIPSHGEEKKEKVISSAVILVSKALRRSLSEKEKLYIKEKVSEQIEDVLAAPQKKLC